MSLPHFFTMGPQPSTSITCRVLKRITGSRPVSLRSVIPGTPVAVHSHRFRIIQVVTPPIQRTQCFYENTFRSNCERPRWSLSQPQPSTNDLKAIAFDSWEENMILNVILETSIQTQHINIIYCWWEIPTWPCHLLQHYQLNFVGILRRCRKRFLQMHGLLPQFQRFSAAQKSSLAHGIVAVEWWHQPLRKMAWLVTGGPGGWETWSWNILAIFEKSREKKTRLQGQGSTSFAQGRLGVENSSTSVEFSRDKKTSDLPVYLQVIPTPIHQ